MAEQTDPRPYALGVRNARTLEDPDTERQRRISWSHVKAWANKPGGKYVA